MENNIEKLLLTIAEIFGVGIAESATERYEQLNKHGFSLERDAKYYQKGELVEAARFCLGVGLWPAEWDIHFRDKIIAKPLTERYRISSAFLCAEIDRLKS